MTSSMSGDCFLICTPESRTSWGSWGMARLTRFWTSTVASSRSRPSSKVTVRFMRPSLALMEFMYIMSCAPLTCCSMGVVTACSTTWALAPVNWVDTCTEGGDICGYCAMGSPKMASTPVMVMTIEMTAEKMGLSMKKLTNMDAP